MAKTQEELKQIKEEYELLTNKLKELTDDELKQVSGGGARRDVEGGFEIESIKIRYKPRPIW